MHHKHNHKQESMISWQTSSKTPTKMCGQTRSLAPQQAVSQTGLLGTHMLEVQGGRPNKGEKGHTSNTSPCVTSIRNPNWSLARMRVFWKQSGAARESDTFISYLRVAGCSDAAGPAAAPLSAAGAAAGATAPAGPAAAAHATRAGPATTHRQHTSRAASGLLRATIAGMFTSARQCMGNVP
jgi:hypothetical protein